MKRNDLGTRVLGAALQDGFPRPALPWLAIMVLFLLPCSAAAEDFPGPISLADFETVSCALPVDWPEGNFQYLALGTREGALYLARFLPLVDGFTVVQRKYIGGEMTWAGHWEDPPGGGAGLVVATRNPDRVLLVKIIESPSPLVVYHEIPLPEDPGACAFAGPQADPGAELLVALPGMDQLVVSTRDSGWAITQTLPAGDGVGDLLAVDLEADGIRELVTADSGVLSGKLGVYRRDAEGTYSRTGTISLAGQVSQLTAFDLTADGRPELVVGYSDQPLVQVLTTEAGELALHSSAELALVPNDLQVCRLPGGRVGMLAAIQERGLVELLGWDSGQWIPQKRFFPGCRPTMLQLGDFNGEGFQDLVCVDSGQVFSTVMFGNEDRDFWGLPALPLDAVPGTSTMADFDGDGRQDLVVADLETGKLSLFLGREDGGFAASGLDYFLSNPVETMTSLEAGGSAGPELALVELYTGALRILDFGMESGFQLMSEKTVQPYPTGILARDVDHDGQDDLVMLQSLLGNVLVMFGDGAGNFSDDRLVNVAGGGSVVRTLDLNGDDLLDLAVTDGGSWVYGFVNEGGRQFDLSTWILAGSGAHDLATGDLDGDGDLDLVVSNRNDETLTFLENDGLGHLVRRIGGHVLEHKPFGLECVDLDQDGNMDVVVHHGAEGKLALVHNVGEWSYGYPLPVRAGLNIRSLQTGDFNLDGFPDLLNLDFTLQLGLTMLNVERVLVDVEPRVLQYACRGEGLEVRVQPDRSGPWELAVEQRGNWRMLAADGLALEGRMVLDEDVWVLLVAWDELEQVVTRLRLTVGQEGQRESLVLTLSEGCEGGGVPVLSTPLGWEKEPWPNPFNPLVHARIVLDDQAHVRAGVFDLAGRRVARLLDQVLPRGVHTLQWNGEGDEGAAAAGVYFLRIEGPGAVLSRKVLLLK